MQSGVRLGGRRASGREVERGVVEEAEWLRKSTLRRGGRMYLIRAVEKEALVLVDSAKIAQEDTGLLV